jgi:FkbM family methyltransferase
VATGVNDMGVPWKARVAMPYARLELPGWGKVLRAAGVYRDDGWDGAPTRVVRGKLHGYKMRLSLESWSERQTYFLGRYYDLHTQALAMICVRSGDTFIDVGGNIGMMTLLGSRLVGATGQVHPFEPNPLEGDRIRRTIEENGIGNVTLYRVGLADAPAELTLTVIAEHSGMGTFAEVGGDEARHVSARYPAKVVRGDDVLPPQLPGAVTIKIDVEGFECRVLRGLSATLAKYRPAVVTEVIRTHLVRAGNSVEELFDVMASHGYRAYAIRIRRRHHLGPQRLWLRPLARGEEIPSPRNVAWVAPGTVHAERLGRYMGE